MIYTSYFAKLKKLEDNNIVPISICAKAPEWYTGIQYKRLAPKFWFFDKYKKDGDEKFFIEQYCKEVLNKLDCNQVLQEIANLTKNGNIALVCYEKSTDFCHRHIVADWFNKKGFYCKEFDL